MVELHSSEKPRDIVIDDVVVARVGRNETVESDSVMDDSSDYFLLGGRHEECMGMVLRCVTRSKG